MYGTQTIVDMIDLNNATKIMPYDHPFIQVNSTYEGTVPNYVYDNMLAGGGPLATEQRGGTGLENLHKSIKCRKHPGLFGNECVPLQLVDWQGGTKNPGQAVKEAIKSGGNKAYHITICGVPPRIHEELIRNIASFYASNGTEVNVRKNRFHQKNTPPRCYQTAMGNITFSGVPLPASALEACPH